MYLHYLPVYNLQPKHWPPLLLLNSSLFRIYIPYAHLEQKSANRVITKARKDDLRFDLFWSLIAPLLSFYGVLNLLLFENGMSFKFDLSEMVGIFGHKNRCWKFLAKLLLCFVLILVSSHWLKMSRRSGILNLNCFNASSVVQETRSKTNTLCSDKKFEEWCLQLLRLLQMSKTHIDNCLLMP